MNIVVVDDDPVIRLLLTRTVEWLGHQVYTAEAATEGDPKDFLRAADDALYRAKSEGRNCTAIATARTSPPPAGPVGRGS